MRAFVAGAVGFAGSSLTEHLLTRGRDVFGLVQNRHETAGLAPALARERVPFGQG